MDAPRFRVWPPIAEGVPILLGLAMTGWLGDPISLASPTWRTIGWVLMLAFVVWNGWTMWFMASRRTAILPGAASTEILKGGTFAISRNPLYLGLLTFQVGLALYLPSFWMLVLTPLSLVALTWGAIVPEEGYLANKFGAEYAHYRARVRRWL